MLNIKQLAKYRWVITFLSCLIFFPCYSYTLKEAICHTLHTNPDIIATIKRLEASHQVILETKSGYLPTLDLHAVFGREWSQNFNTPEEGATLWRRELGLTLRQLLFDGFEIRNEVIRTMAVADAESYRIRGQTQDTSLAVAETYINILRDRELVKASVHNTERLKKLYLQIKRRGEQGVGRISDTYQARARYEVAVANMYSLQGQLNEDEITFLQLTGLCPDCLELPPIPNEKDLPCDEWYAVEFALGNHPILKSAIAEVEAARAKYHASKAPFYPKVELILAANNNQDLGGVPGPNNNRYAILQLSYNLFRGGHDIARMKETKFQLQESMEVRNQASREVIQQVSLAWNAKEISDKRLPYLLAQKKDMAVSLRAYYQQFLVGRRSLIDLLNAENEEFTAIQAYTNTYYLNIVAKYRVLNHTGGLAQFLCVDLPIGSFPSYNAAEGCREYRGTSVMVNGCPPPNRECGTKFYHHVYVPAPPVHQPVPCAKKPKCPCDED